MDEIKQGLGMLYIVMGKPACFSLYLFSCASLTIECKHAIKACGIILIKPAHILFMACKIKTIKNTKAYL